MLGRAGCLHTRVHVRVHVHVKCKPARCGHVCMHVRACAVHAPCACACGRVYSPRCVCMCHLNPVCPCVPIDSPGWLGGTTRLPAASYGETLSCWCVPVCGMEVTCRWDDLSREHMEL